MREEIVKQITNVVDSKKEEITKFTLELVKELSEAPPGDETAVAKLIKKQALKWGLPEPEIWSKKANRPNLIFTLKGKKSRRTLILSGHMDTKPIFDVNKWKKINPYNPKIIDGKLYGRGSTDMKGGVVGFIAAAMAILYCKIPLNGDLILALTADEEGGCVYGSNFLVERGLKGDAMLIAEPSGIEKDFDSLAIAGRATVIGTVVVHGTQMHSSISDKGGCINASVKLAKVLVEFAENLKKQICYKPHPLYPNGPTINPGTLNDGLYFAFGVVPDIASFDFDIRITPGITAEGIKRDVEDFLDKLKEKDKDLQVEVVWKKPLNQWALPVEIERDHPLVLSCIEAAKEVIGIEPNLVGVPFSTDGCHFVKLNTKVISSFGPGFIRLAHGPDEYVNIQAVLDAAKIFALSAVGYLNY